MTAAFRRLAKRVDAPGLRLHDLRHGHATLMLVAGIHPKVVSERLGHSTVALTLDMYSHVAPRLQAEAAGKLDDLPGAAPTVP
jgi:integrase